MGDTHSRRGRKRTEITPAQTFLGALAPMPGPVAMAPPGMVEQKCSRVEEDDLDFRRARKVDLRDGV